MTRDLSRRKFLGGLGLGAGALALGGNALVRRATAAGGLGQPGSGRGITTSAAGETPHLVVIYLAGGINAFLGSADSFLLGNKFGVTSSNIQDLGNEVFVDQSTIGALPADALQHLAVIGCKHGIAAHPTAQRALWNSDGRTSDPLTIAAAIDSAAAMRCVAVGNSKPGGPNTPIAGVSMQLVSDMPSALVQLGGADALGVDRGIGSRAMLAAKAQSAAGIARSPDALASLDQGYDTAAATLALPAQTLDLAGTNTAYGLATTSTTVSTFAEKMRAAELMIMSGTSVVTAITGGWDTHGDVDGSVVRTKMGAEIIGPLGTFLSRMMVLPSNRNVVTVLTGDFSRSLPGSDHQPNLSSLVFGKYCELGTTGKVDDRVRLLTDPGALNEHWAYLAAALKLPTNPYGANPHGLIL